MTGGDYGINLSLEQRCNWILSGQDCLDQGEIIWPKTVSRENVQGIAMGSAFPCTNVNTPAGKSEDSPDIVRVTYQDLCVLWKECADGVHRGQRGAEGIELVAINGISHSIEDIGLHDAEIGRAGCEQLEVVQ